MSRNPHWEAQLSNVQRRWALYDSLRCIAIVLLAVGPLCLLLGWLDYEWDFSQTVRMLELGGLFVFLIWLFRNKLSPLIARRRDAYTTALLVESRFHQFAGRLVSRVEFAQTPLSECMSASLANAMSERVDSEVERTNLELTIDFGTLRRSLAGAALVSACLLTTVAAEPTLAGLWIKRTLLPFSDAPWPRRTQIEGIEPEYRIRRGDRLAITGRTSGEIPGRGEVQWKESASLTGLGGSGGDLAFDVRDDGSFSVEIGPFLENMTLTLEAGDAIIAEIPVEVVVPPELAEIQASYNYPEYTGRASDTVQSGDVRAIVGTKVDLTLHADRPTERVELAFIGPEGRRIQQAELDSPTQALSAKSSFTVESRGRYEVRMYDVYGFSADTPATFVIDPIDNELPQITLNRPGKTHKVAPGTRLRLKFTATDDYGVTSARVNWTSAIDNAETPTTLPAGESSIPVFGARRNWDASYDWDLANLELDAGDTITFHVEVGDEGKHLTSETTGVSATHTLKVISAQDLENLLATRLKDALGELEVLSQEQSTGYNEVGVSRLKLSQAENSVLPVDVQRLQIELNRQRRIQRQVERLAGRLTEIADEQRDSFLADDAQVEHLHQLSAELIELASDRIEKIVADLDAARRSALTRAQPDDQEGSP